MLIENSISIVNENDICYVLSLTRKLVDEVNPSEMDKQKVLVAVSELAHNILDHAGGNGYIACKRLSDGIQILASDKGPGIKDLELVLKGEVRSSAHGLGKGLAGVHRLMDDVFIETDKGGTKIIATKWFSE